MEWYETDFAHAVRGPSMARWFIRLTTAAGAMFLLGWVGGAYIQWAL